MKRIILLATGGTIASQKSEAEGPLVPAYRAAELLDFIPQVRRDICVPSAKDIMFMDSSNIQPEHWQEIAREIFSALSDYDGIVITHGTDTLAYTSSMMSYMLQGLNKPVIFTGAQKPINDLMSDGRRNLEAAFAAAVYGTPGVYVLFDNQIINGARATKLRSMGFNAFASINAPLSGTVDSRGIIIEYPQPQSGEFRLSEKLCPDVFLFKLMPGTKPEIVDHVIDIGYRGVIIEAFGVGGMHFLHRNLIEKLELLCDKGITVLIISQCTYDSVDLSVYESGTKLPEFVVSGRDMTTEAAVTKMMWALGQSDDPLKVAEILKSPVCGEFGI